MPDVDVSQKAEAADVVEEKQPEVELARNVLTVTEGQAEKIG